MSTRQELIEAIEALEAQREELGDSVVDTALMPLREKLAGLEAAEPTAEPEAEPSSERRVVTILFCDVVGSTALAEKMDPEEWTEIMNAAFERLNEPIHSFGGIVARLMGDAILAFFGAPTAHEDDPQRAVGAGLAILEKIHPLRESLQRDRGLAFNVRIGINTGLAVVGEVGSDIHGEYTAMGDAVNLAARMEQTAEPGTMQIAESTYKLVAPYFKCEALGGIEVKGKSEPVQAFRVLARKAESQEMRGLVAQGVSSPLVGREAEFAQAKNTVERLLDGQGGILSIIGEAGIGKSRLISELRSSVATTANGDKNQSVGNSQLTIDNSQLVWLEGHTLSYGQTISYWAFQEILRDYAGINEDDSEAESWRKLESRINSLFPENAAEVLPYLASLLALEVSDEYTERVKYLDGEAMGQQVRVASRRFFARLAAARPLVLVFEDLHWMDASSAQLLALLLPLVGQVPVLLCGLSRPNPGNTATSLRDIAAQDFGERYTEIRLAPLSGEDSVQLVQNLIAIEGLPARMRELIVSKADGNPFFLEEIIRDLIDSGGVVRDPASGRWKATAQVENIPIPDTIQGVLIARIDRLDEEVKRVLRRAAVIGRTFLYRVLRSVLESDTELDERLTELQAAELVREQQRLPELEYIFKHALARDATYESILLKRRRELHDQVGGAIESLFADRLEEFYGLLAYHYAQAEAWEKAREYLLKAGDQSGRVAAGAEALAHYRQAVTAYERAFGDEWDPLERASLARKMADAYYVQGHLGPSREHYQQALTMIDKGMPTTMVGLSIGLLGQVAQQALHRLWPTRFLDRDPGQRRAALIEAAHTYDRLGELFYFMAEPIHLTYAWLRSLNLAEVAGPSPELARAYVSNSVVAVQAPLTRWLAGLYGRLALETVEGHGDLSALAWVLQGDGIRNIIIGRWTDAIDSTSRGAKVNSRIGGLRWWEESWGSMAVSLNLKGDFAQGRKTWAEVYASAHERGDKQVQLWSLCGQATAALRLGEVGHADSALVLLKRAAGLLAEYAYAHGPDEIRAYGLLAQARLRKGEAALAVQAAELADRSIGAELLPSTFYSFEGYVGPPLVYLSLWEEQIEGQDEITDEDSYRESARQARRGLRRYAWVFPFARPRSWLFQGWYAWLAGKRGKAHKAWRKSLKYARDLDMPYEEGLAHFEIGRHLPASDTGREEHLQHAIDIFGQLDAAWDLKRAQETLIQA